MALLIVPVSALAVALALPMMRVIAVGQSKGGAGVLAAALASLALGLYPYSAFLLFARALYALDDSRTPAVVALVTAIVGAAVDVRDRRRSCTATAVVAATGLGSHHRLHPRLARPRGASSAGASATRSSRRRSLPTTLIAGAYRARRRGSCTRSSNPTKRGRSPRVRASSSGRWPAWATS